jgi:hypothetical protein
MMHYIPVDGLYVYFRYDARQTIMCVMNTAKTESVVDFSKYAERTTGFTKAKNVISGEMLEASGKIAIPAMRTWVLELSN